MNSTIGRNVSSGCERYHITIDSIVKRTYLVNNIDRFVRNELEELVSDNVNVLRELIYSRVGTVNLSNFSFRSKGLYDILQLITSVCTW